MKWKKRLAEILLLILTFLLPVAIGNHRADGNNGVERVKEIRQHGAGHERNKSNNVPGHQTAILQNGHVIHLDHLQLLDPYNLIASVKQNGNKLNPFLEEVLPKNRKSSETNHKHKHHRHEVNNVKKLSGDEDEDKNDIVNSLNQQLDIDSNDNKSGSKGLETSSERSKEGSYFDENDFNLYDDYDELGTVNSVDDFSDDNDFNSNLKERRKRKKGNFRNAKGQNNALLHEAVRKLLGFSSAHSWGHKKSQFLPDPFGQEKMPRYVKDLYERFQSGEMNAGLAQGNTIRSIHASVGDVEGESMFLFNLSSLRSSERLLNAEIHLYKRRFRPKGLHKLDIEVKLYRVAPHYLSEVGRITMREDVSHGWLWYDVTNAVENCVNPRRRHADLFALSFRVKKPNGKIKSVSLRKFGRHHSMPFLVLYSNETEAVSFEHIDILTDRLWPKEKEDTSQNNRAVLDIDSINSRKGGDDDEQSNTERAMDTKGNNEITSYDENESVDHDDQSTPPTSTFRREEFIYGLNTKTKRNKRSIYDNEIPEDSADDDGFQGYDIVNTIPQTHPRIIKNRKGSGRVHLKLYPSSIPLPPYYGTSNNNNNDNDNSKNKNNNDNNKNNVNKTKNGNKNNTLRRRGKKNQRRKKYDLYNRHNKNHYNNHRQSRIPFPKSWDVFAAGKKTANFNSFNDDHKNHYNNDNKNHANFGDFNNLHSSNNIYNKNVVLNGLSSSSSSSSSGKVCGRQRLTVDFADIGWGDWIISPKSFEAHYCAGSCPFPLNKGLHPSNHATIQSIVHAIGIHSNVPAPCCVPDKMASVTLLYFDEERNVVLKNYPGMTVESCACR